MGTPRKKRTPRTPKKKTNSPKKHPSRKAKPELVLETYFSPILAWMYPYLRKAKGKMPNLILPKRVRSHRPSKTRIMRVLGNAYNYNRTIVVSTHNQLTYMGRNGDLKVKKIVRLPQAQMLDTLAHEIAHLHYPTHGYEHEEFSRAIFKTFGLQTRCPYCKGSGKVQLEGRY